jgi:peroxiredoxin
MSEQRQRLGTGDRVTPFTLPSSTGAPVVLEDLLARGPVVLAWYLFDFGRV